MRLRIFNIILVGIFSISHSFSDIPEVNKKPTIEVRVLRVPAFQSIMKSTPQVEEGVSGVVMGGNVSPIITNKHNLILILNFEVHKGQLTAEDLHESKNSFEKELFNQALEMSADKTLLVGFAPPKFEGSSRGSAYWLIFSLKN